MTTPSRNRATSIIFVKFSRGYFNPGGLMRKCFGAVNYSVWEDRKRFVCFKGRIEPLPDKSNPYLHRKRFEPPYKINLKLQTEHIWSF